MNKDHRKIKKKALKHWKTHFCFAHPVIVKLKLHIKNSLYIKEDVKTYILKYFAYDKDTEFCAIRASCIICLFAFKKKQKINLSGNVSLIHQQNSNPTCWLKLVLSNQTAIIKTNLQKKKMQSVDLSKTLILPKIVQVLINS